MDSCMNCGKPIEERLGDGSYTVWVHIDRELPFGGYYSCWKLSGEDVHAMPDERNIWLRSALREALSGA